VDRLKPERFHLVLDMDLSQFLEEFPFAIAGVCAQHFSDSKHNSKEIFSQELVFHNSFDDERINHRRTLKESIM
jgi:hypothetical protein